MCIIIKKNNVFTSKTCFNIHALLWPSILSFFFFWPPYLEKVVHPCFIAQNFSIYNNPCFPFVCFRSTSVLQISNTDYPPCISQEVYIEGFTPFNHYCIFIFLWKGKKNHLIESRNVLNWKFLIVISISKCSDLIKFPKKWFSKMT